MTRFFLSRVPAARLENHGVGGAGLIRLALFAGATGPFTHPNPFANPRTLDIDGRIPAPTWAEA